MASSRLYEIAKKIVEILQGLDLPDLRADDIRIEPYGMNDRPAYGLIISPLPESESPGLNNRDDIIYSYKITRVYHSVDGDLQPKAPFRDAIRKRFNWKRIGYSDSEACEIVTRVKHSEIETRTDWERSDYDNNVLVISVQMRVVRN